MKLKKRGFTLIELIVVIVVIGILATLAVAGFSSVITRSRDSVVEQTARSLGRQIITQAAFDAASPQQYQYLNVIASTGDLPASVTIQGRNVARTGTVVVANAGTVATSAAIATNTVYFAQLTVTDSSGRNVCMSLPTASSGTVGIATGTCVSAAM